MMIFLNEAKAVKEDIDLIALIYEFWMKMFRDFVKEIWKHSDKYTLKELKKRKESSS